MSTDVHKKLAQLLFQRPLDRKFIETKQFTDNLQHVIATFRGMTANAAVAAGPKNLSDYQALSMNLEENTTFSLFKKSHRNIASKLIGMLCNEKAEADFLTACVAARKHCHPQLFQYCYAVALQYRDEFNTVAIPAITELFPHYFVDCGHFKLVKADIAESSNKASKQPKQFIDIPFNFTAAENELEQQLAYFREDIGVNSHHWHWHLIYPASGPKAVIEKDRRGELFYYMHHQIVARYNCERLSNRLERVKKLHLFEPIAEGYHPKLLNSVTQRTYAARSANACLTDVKRDGENIKITDLVLWTARIIEAIDQGFVIDSAQKLIALNNDSGIDLLGNLLESSDQTINTVYYGDLHNELHVTLAYIHDPIKHYLEDLGVMGDITTSMRDPVFYRVHAYIDELFNRHKDRLPVYADKQLGYEAIEIINCKLQSTRKLSTANTLRTHWQKSVVDLGTGLDFGQNENVCVRFQHLQHEPFDYRIEVVNNRSQVRHGTCRIFLLPMYDESGVAMPLAEQRLLAIELDKFMLTLNPGHNSITRSSLKSSVTIPYSQTFRRQDAMFNVTDESKLSMLRFCGCGWPQHLLIPKGSIEGTAFQLFVMISNYDDDAIDRKCNNFTDATSYCGLRSKKYPDRRAMGFPFERGLPAESLNELTAAYKNMKAIDVKIVFENIVKNQL